MSLGSEHEVRKWLNIYLEQYHGPPQHADQLCAFARHRGAHLVYRLVREELSSLSTFENIRSDVTLDHLTCTTPHAALKLTASLPGSETIASHPVLQRFRSETKVRSDERALRITRRSASLPRSARASSTDAKCHDLTVASSEQSGTRCLAAQLLAHSYRTVAERLLVVEAATCARKTVEQFGLNVDHSIQNSLSTCQATCLICLDNQLCVRSAGHLCVERGCRGWFCPSCIQEYFERIIQDAPFSVPTIRCPSCAGVVPPSCWQMHIKEETAEQWQSHAENLLSLRCGECDEPGSLLQKHESGSREQLATSAFGQVDQASASELVSRWKDFERGARTAADLLDFLLHVWCIEDAMDTKEPKKFREHIAPTYALIEDVGLRAILQLAALKRFPKTTTSCCDAEHCFKCKVATHHEGISCEEVQLRQMPEDGVQFCPSCGVATLKTEGCNHMICLCGENWTWDGSESWVNEWAEE